MKNNTTISELKSSKMLSAKEIQNLCPNISVIGFDSGPIMQVANRTYQANTCSFDTIEEVADFLNDYHGQYVFIYNMRTVKDNNLYTTNFIDVLNKSYFRLDKGDKLLIVRDNETLTIDVDVCCEFNINTRNSNINNQYSKFMFRMFEEIEVDSDSFADCDSIEKCIIEKVESSLTEVASGNKD